MHVSLGGTVRRDNRACITSRRGCPDAGPRDIPTMGGWSQPDRIKNTLGRHRVQLSVGRSPVGSKAGHLIGPEAGPA